MIVYVVTGRDGRRWRVHCTATDVTVWMVIGERGILSTPTAKLRSLAELELWLRDHAGRSLADLVEA